MSGQKPLPTSPFKPKDIPESKTDAGLSRGNSYRSNKSPDSQDAGMEDEEADNGSDNESVSDSVRPSKKKKGQRFFCKDYPPCQLSFTRSEHLARHIRYVTYILTYNKVFIDLAPRAPPKNIIMLTFMQETYWRTTISVSLLTPLFPFG